MPSFSIRYESLNIYEHPVSEAVFDFLIKPCHNEFQSLSEVFLNNSLGFPASAYVNTFGFEVDRLRADRPFKELEFSMSTFVNRVSETLPSDSILMPHEERREFENLNFQIDQFLYLRNSLMTEVPVENDLLIWKSGQPLFDYLQLLNKYIYSHMDFDPGVTTVQTPAQDALRLKRGVCQDYTHIFIGHCRNQGIPARYVSGYLSQGYGFAGDLQMHAWPEVWLPGYGWVGFDPTNNLFADDHYVRVAHG